MRISLVRVLAALALALLGTTDTTSAQDYSFLTQAGYTNGAYATSYYAPEAPTGNNFTSNTEAEPQAATSVNTSWGGCDDDCSVCCDDVGTWRENTLVSLGGEAYKSLGDTDPPPGPSADYMNSAGVVGTFNTGFALGGLESIRGQVGASYGVYDWKGRDTVSVSSSEQQTFITLGVYKRSDICCGDRVSWGAVYDQFWGHQWGLFASELYVGQVRGIVGWARDEWNEFGVWGAFRTTSDNSVTGISPPAVRAMNQYNVYWRHNFDFGAQTMFYVGGNDPADLGSWQLGCLGQAPMNDSLALYGNFVMAQPSSSTGIIGSNEQEWAFGVGLTYFFGAKAVSPTVSGRKGLPLLPVANNGSFLITN